MYVYILDLYIDKERMDQRAYMSKKSARQAGKRWNKNGRYYWSYTNEVWVHGET